jgi:hypothetical protein
MISNCLARRGCLRTMKALKIALGVNFALAASAVGLCAADTKPLYDEALKYFSQAALIPIVISEAQEVGDVFDARTKSLLAHRSECFPKLPNPDTSKTALPDLKSTTSTNVGFALALSALGKGELQGVTADSVNISFRTAVISSISMHALQSAADYTACPFLNTVFNGRAENSAGEIPIVIGLVIRAQQHLDLSFKNSASANLAVVELRKFFTRIGVGGNITFERQNQTNISLSSNETLPVAFRPIYSPTVARAVAEIRAGDSAPSGARKEEEPSPSRMLQDLYDEATKGIP